jgi:Concanavalin A-like lectin/glucanases superfamily
MGRAKLIAGLASAVMLVGAGPAAANVLPVGTWSFNESSGTVAHDTSFQPDNGTLQGGAAWTRGRFRNALSFDGNASGVDIPDRPILDSPQVTVSAWVNSASSPGKFKYIAAKGASGCIAGAWGLYTGANGGLEFYVSNNDGLTYAISPDAGTGIWDGNWHSVIGTFNGSSVDLYVDGKEVGTGTRNTTPIDYGLPTSSDLMIGDYAGCSGLDFSGNIDEVHVFNRALGAQEIHFGYVASDYIPQQFFDDAIL